MSEETPTQETRHCCGQCQNHITPSKVSEESIRLLSQTLKNTSDSIWMVDSTTRAGADSGSGASTRTGWLGKDGAKLFLQTLKTTSEAVSNVAGVARNNAIATSTEVEKDWLSVEARNTTNLIRHLETEDVRIPLILPGFGIVTGNRTFVISQRVGTVSLETWQGLSERKLKELDITLRRIVQRICDHGIGWDSTGKIIQEELATFGFRFATASNFPGDAGFQRAADKTTSDLARIQALSDHCRFALTKDWYTDEMIRVVQRLMELRGFEI